MNNTLLYGFFLSIVKHERRSSGRSGNGVERAGKEGERGCCATCVWKRLRCAGAVRGAARWRGRFGSMRGEETGRAGSAWAACGRRAQGCGTGGRKKGRMGSRRAGSRRTRGGGTEEGKSDDIWMWRRFAGGMSNGGEFGMRGAGGEGKFLLFAGRLLQKMQNSAAAGTGG